MEDSVSKAVSHFTWSDLRLESLVQLSNRLTRVPSVVQELLSWNMKLSFKLGEMKGRLLNYSSNNALSPSLSCRA